MADAPRAAEIRDELRHALPEVGEVLGVRPLLKGHGHESFVLETGSGARLLLKIALRGDQLAGMRSMRHVLDLVAAHQIPAPRLLHLSEGGAPFGGRPWLVQEFLAGQDGEDTLAQMSDAERTAFFHDFGRVVARLHAIDIGYFAEDFASAPREQTWLALVEARVERLVHSNRQAGLLEAERIDRARDVILSAARRTSSRIRPAIVHRDLYLPNTLIAGGRFRCLLDFEHARSADALTDFVKLAMWVFARVPGSEVDFCAGYGGNPMHAEDGRLRFRVAFGLELLAGLPYWQRTGQGEMLADYRRRFDPWLAGR